jgi:hypothetical protein
MDFINSEDAPIFCHNEQIFPNQLDMIKKNMQTFESASTGKPSIISPVMKGRTYIAKEFNMKNERLIPKLQLMS